ncbi:hypothetical protein TCAL_16354 [Tigriopus californicus]|uniref:Alpha 1,4-glycosyltransferase domain-containing protein n=1 Tax=Tigriopus californicus TaxID=6832 RepID=A0A553NZ47_TIGCA|nr:hypothetical protein TCAL_16354 [Tigriopus californicus]
MRRQVKALTVSNNTIRVAVNEDFGLRYFLRSPRHLLTTAMKVKRLNRCQKVMCYLKSNGSKVKIFLDQKIFTVDQDYKRSNNLFLAQSTEEAQWVFWTKHPAQVMVLGLLYTILPWVKKAYPQRNYVWHQDGAPSHMAKKNQNFCKVVGDGSVIGENLNNAVFHFDKGHPYLELCLEQFAINFDPMVRLSGGPYTMSKALKKICGMEENSIINLNTFTRDRCRGVGVVKQHLLYPLGWFEIDVFTSERKSRSQWAAKYNSSITIHLFNSIAGSDKVVLKPKFYGNDVPAYLYLAERFCPLCYNSVKRF